jgi:hypothetical protein
LARTAESDSINLVRSLFQPPVKFAKGCRIDAEFLRFVANDLIGRNLSKDEADQVLERRRVVMKYASRA